MYLSNKYQTHETAARTGGDMGSVSGQFSTAGGLWQWWHHGMSWNITHELVSSVFFHSNQQFGNVQISNCHVVESTHPKFVKQSGQLIILEPICCIVYYFRSYLFMNSHKYLWERPWSVGFLDYPSRCTVDISPHLYCNYFLVLFPLWNI